MELNRSEASGIVASIYRLLDVIWEGYEKRPDPVDIETAIAMMQDELDSYDRPAAMTVPGLRLKVDKDEDGGYNVHFFVGTIEREE
jgi:hypothetical protein